MRGSRHSRLERLACQLARARPHFPGRRALGEEALRTVPQRVVPSSLSTLVTSPSLHTEITDLYDWLRPSALEYALRIRVLARVRDVIVGLWPHAHVECFGSLRTGLFLPGSDIDVLVESRKRIGRPPLWTLAEAMRRAGIAERIQVLNKVKTDFTRFL